MTNTLPIVMLSLLALGCGGKHYLAPPIPFRGDSAVPSTAGVGIARSGLSNTQPSSAALPRPDPPPPTTNDFGSQTTNERDRRVKDTLASINKLLDAYFDFNAYHLRPDAVASVTEAAAILKDYMNADPAIRLVIEGHCDERGSAEFNLGLGDRRAESVRDLLAQMALPAERMSTISYGETRPACGEATEACWQQNRRAHIRHER